MNGKRPFRFGTGCFPARSRTELVNLARKIEDLGYATILMPNHAHQMSTFLALLLAAEATKHVRLGATVMNNDFRHPALLAREAATFDVLSEGRLELGMGAGYLAYDYTATGIPLDPPGVRVRRLAESVQIVKRFLAGETATFAGNYYTTQGLVSSLPARQQPRPPLLIGGGGKQLLSLAAREADIVSIVPKAKPGALDFNNSSHAATEQKIAWIQKAAGERLAVLELNTLVFECVVTDQRQQSAEELAQRWGLPVSHILNSIHFLVGTVEQITEAVQMWRERFGISYVAVFPQFMDAFAPVVAKLAGR